MHWDRDRLLMDLGKFSFRAKPIVKGEIIHYYDFYDMNFYQQFEGLEQRVGWIETGEFRLVMQSFKPVNAKATVFIFHGYFDHAGIYHHLIRYLLKHDFAVVIYDMPGHGLSSGKPTAITTFQQYQDAMNTCLDVCKNNLPLPYHCVGQSTGAAVIVDRIKNGEASELVFDKIVLLSPLVRPKGWKSIVRIHSAVKPFVKVWFRSFSKNSEDVSFLRFLRDHDPLQSKWLSVDWISALREWIPTIESGDCIKRKILIIQGTGDNTVDWKHNLEVLKRLFSEVKISYIDDAQHHLVNESLGKREAVFKSMLTEIEGF
jgi:lysophospholipase